MRKIIFVILFLLSGVLAVQAQGSGKKSSKLIATRFDKEPAKASRRPVFNKKDSSFNKKMSKQKKKENTARRRRGRNNAKVREMEVERNRRDAEFGRMMERKGRK